MSKDKDNEAPERATMNQVVVNRTDLLGKLVENKARHDALFKVAVEGYWKLAATKVADKEETFYEKVAKLRKEASVQFKSVAEMVEKRQPLPASIYVPSVSLDGSLGLAYPENHSREYDRAIEMMKMSVHAEVTLTVAEFDAYVMNEWTWKAAFLGSTSAYISSVTGCMLPFDKWNTDTGGSLSYCSGMTMAYNDLTNGIIRL